MGTMLKSINPQAAADIEHGGPPAGTPPIADFVVFRPRAGMRRGGRTEFPAMVMHAHDDGSLDLLVIVDANDVWGQQRVRKATDAEPLNAWVLRESAREVEHFEPSRLNGMTRDFALMKAQLFGDFVLPEGQSIMAFLDGFGRRITALERGAPAKPKAAKRK